MAEEQASTAAATAPAAVSSPLSSPSPSPSASTEAAAPAAVSAQTPASPDTTSQKTERPQGIPDSYWDAEKNSLKVDPVSLANDLKERDDLKTFKAAEDVKAASRPQKPEDYKLDLPADFKPPAGVEYKLDAANPALGQLRAVAHKYGMSQDAVSEILGIYAGNEVGTQQQIANAKAVEVTKLGATGPARIDAAVNFVTGIDGTPDKRHANAFAEMMVAARHIEAFEYLQNKITSQGAAGFSTAHRAAPETGIPGFEKMSFEQRRAAQDRNAAARRTA